MSTPADTPTPTPTSSESTSERQPWEAPTLTVIHIDEATQGGFGPVNDQDDAFYVVS